MLLYHLVMLTLAVMVKKVDVRLEPADYEMKLTAIPTPGPAEDFQVHVQSHRS
jgi:hypothetical protein